MPSFTRKSPNCVLAAAAAGAALAGATAARAQCLNDKLLPSNPVAQEFNFDAGSIDNDRIVLGRSGVTVGGEINQGQAQFFIRQGLQWVSDGVVTGNESDGGERFGSDVDIYGETAAIAAPFHFIPGQPGSGHGSVYVFDWFLFGGWTQNVMLTDPTPESNARFGASAALFDDWIAVGAPFDNNINGTDAGSVYLYQRVSGNWVFKQQVADLTGDDFNHMGWSVDVYDRHMVAGSPDDDVFGTSGAGSAALYKVSAGGVWQFLQNLFPQDVANSESFGDSVAITSDMLIIGAPRSTVAGNTSAGSVSIFSIDFDTNTWVLDQTIPNPDPTNISFFGSTVAIDGGRAVITAAIPSSVFVYTRHGMGNWTPDGTITDPDGGAGQFGSAAEIDGSNLLVCDPADDSIVANNGAAYVYTYHQSGGDDCDDANLIALGSKIGCNGAATTDGSAGCAPSGKDVWYTFSIGSAGWYQFDTEGSDFDTVLSIHDGWQNCPRPVLACDDDGGAGSSSLIQMFVGFEDRPQIRVAGYDFGAGDIRSGSFLLNITRIAPLNNDCAGAIPVTEGSYEFATYLATTDGFAESLCSFFGDPQINQDVWYTYTASCSGTATISLCDSSYDTDIAVYSGAGCPAPAANPIACNDDFCASGSQVTFAVAAGQAYKVRVGGFGAETGEGTMVISVAQTCPGDADGMSPVGVGDIAVVINHWSQAVAGCNNGDLSGNGTVGLEDVAIIINNWTATCP